MTANHLNKCRRKVEDELTEYQRNLIAKQLEKEQSNNPKIPQLCQSIDRHGPLNLSLELINRTNTMGKNHKACVCVVCDCFIIGTEPIHWLTTEQLKMKESYLSVDFLESYTTKLSPNLRNQYKIIDNIHLSNLLLSPRAHVRNNSYMSCETCYRHIVYGKSETPLSLV